MKKINFDKEFWWGTASSGPQSEGFYNKSNQNIYDFWYETDPKSFFNEVGPEIASSVYENGIKDLDLMSEIKLNSFRTSIQWSRLIENFETTSISEEGYKFYRKYFEEIKAKNIILIVNLFHFDMPLILQNNGGWESKETIDKFVNYANKCFELFGDIVDHWATFNEPIVPAEGGYLYQRHYPQIKSFKRAVQVAYNSIVAHSKVVKLFKEKFHNLPNKKICIILNLSPFYPKDNSKENKEASNIANLLFTKSFLDPVLKGDFPKELVDLLKKNNLLPIYFQEELEIIKKVKIDYLGINYYQPKRVQAPLEKYEGEIMPEKWFEEFIWEKRRMNIYRGIEIYPKTIYDIAIDLKDNYQNFPWFISENGMGVENESRFINRNNIIEDDYRIEFIKEHLYWINKAINQGANCFGYHLWTFLDNWSWRNAYKNRYGLFGLNLETQERIYKKSAFWFKEMLLTNTIEFTKDEIINFEKNIYKE